MVKSKPKARIDMPTQLMLVTSNNELFVKKILQQLDKFEEICVLFNLI